MSENKWKTNSRFAQQDRIITYLKKSEVKKKEIYQGREKVKYNLEENEESSTTEILYIHMRK